MMEISQINMINREKKTGRPEISIEKQLLSVLWEEAEKKKVQKKIVQIELVSQAFLDFYYSYNNMKVFYIFTKFE